MVLLVFDISNGNSLLPTDHQKRRLALFPCHDAWMTTYLESSESTKNYRSTARMFRPVSSVFVKILHSFVSHDNMLNESS
jgi:hypothetical protein